MCLTSGHVSYRLEHDVYHLEVLELQRFESNRVPSLAAGTVSVSPAGAAPICNATGCEAPARIESSGNQQY